MWIDTHCHLDANEFAGESDMVAARAAGRQVSRIVIPTVDRSNFTAVQELARRNANCAYALGIHPMYVPGASEDDLAALREMIRQAMDDPCFVAVGEIGLDFFIPGLGEGPVRERQEFFFSEQLKIARDFELPVLLHIRRAQDTILKYLRRFSVPGGIAHAFNGSRQQADVFIGLGFKLGFGGAMTFSRASRIRALAAELPQEALVLETDAPDIPPTWIQHQRNSPEELPRIGQALADLRGIAAQSIAQITSANARNVLPRLAA
ncbi:MAG TPA: TatD family hydrolase [Noviherbaspirillum sp.]|uniref:TatD family hydrolase n=1 Tax=Noviherbaspirillum sp. TaxID=1926288 RepID=UPI002B467295|nr:TatD family hydrolase [Noviherbaspirillum sp.]HJV88279.1 TatD family hydrolase [Noviherbaspirillum sp.]